MEQTLPVGLRISLLHRAFRRRMDERLRELDLTGVQFGVLGELMRLEEAGVEVNQRALETATHVTHPTMTEIIRRLEQKGFLLCQPGRNDRRSKRIVSTDKARALQLEIDRLDREVFRWLCAGLEPGQAEAFLAMTDKMLEKVFSACKAGSNDCGK